ncbi:hypothetical protein Hypma_005881 [Hypsizygus marmoreus]|uniref:Uncharacterized protein n=1 Tax=Hypsizygus marmoreus TaxID=39966 RepID=A0A369KG68_HYPMA|nr:hypothetical protein Hypma_005881 [Hypsizygus marmoreus]
MRKLILNNRILDHVVCTWTSDCWDLSERTGEHCLQPDLSMLRMGQNVICHSDVISPLRNLLGVALRRDAHCSFDPSSTTRILS